MSDLPSLVFLSYGSGIHQDETRFAIHSAARHLDPGGGPFRILLYTDEPNYFADLPADITHLDRPQLVEWSGGLQGYRHRAKTMSMIDVLQRQTSPAVFSDGDTWYRRSPMQLFDRVGPGRSVLHLFETRLLDIRDRSRHRLAAYLAEAEFTDCAGHPFSLETNAQMWNSGVAGIHPADIQVLLEARHLAEQMWSDLREAGDYKFTLEQFTLGTMLLRHTRVQEGADVVFHYWNPLLRDGFRERLPRLLAEAAERPAEQRSAFLHPHRPRPRGTHRARVTLKRLYRATGRQTPSVRWSG